MTTPKRSLSLVNPNLSGLWSSNHLGKDNDTFSILSGTIAISLLIYPWVLGFFTPVIILTLIYFQQYKISIAIVSILLYPYIVKIEQWGFWQEFMTMGCNYFQGGVSTSFEFEMDFNHPLLICLHPHGLFSFGVFYNGLRGRIGGNDYFTSKQKQYYWGDKLGSISKIMKRLQGYGLIDNKLLNSPIFTHIVVGWCGGFVSASKKSLCNLMEKAEKSGFLVPGGFNEASLLKKGQDFVYIENRKGFIKYALKYGYAVLPGYTFGECETYNTALSGESKLKTWLVNNNIPCVLPYGPYFWSWFLLPFRKNIGLHTVYGHCKKFPKIDKPTREDVATYHKWYVDELKRIFDDNKWRFGMKGKELEIV
mmetsp:Transcript_33594/g.29394  ORF Transcript_33594/g.29394 Transcript_33594/m.29394 type:complete len:365 (-) Transcript_33594:154-1248(-)